MTASITPTAKTYAYKGWVFHQVRRGHWAMRRLSDGFSTWHQTRTSCEAFIRLHGLTANPEQSLAASYLPQ